jgi:radical SAM superfamily enzyme with C-terminal helix-hairpin-helix motif
LNCDAKQLKSAIRLINKHGRGRGARGLPNLLPGLNFIAGLNGESSASYDLNLNLLHEIRNEGLLLRRINIRQVEGEGFQDISQKDFNSFKSSVRDNIDGPLLQELFPLGEKLCDVHWETHDGRTRLAAHQTEAHTSKDCHGKAGISFGRQIGAYPILIGVEYHIPLETQSDIIVTGHGARSITGVEINLNHTSVSQKQLEAIPGIGEKTAWKLVSQRAKNIRKNSQSGAYQNPQQWFDATNVDWNDDFAVFFQ